MEQRIGDFCGWIRHSVPDEEIPPTSVAAEPARAAQGDPQPKKRMTTKQQVANWVAEPRAMKQKQNGQD